MAGEVKSALLCAIVLNMSKMNKTSLFVDTVACINQQVANQSKTLKSKINKTKRKSMTIKKNTATEVKMKVLRREVMIRMECDQRRR